MVINCPQFIVKSYKKFHVISLAWCRTFFIRIWEVLYIFNKQIRLYIKIKCCRLMRGVEGHIFQLSQCLLELGHKVVVITHFYKSRNGVRYMTNGLKVYYLPMIPFYNQCVLPCVYVSCSIIRDILLREKITIVHGHSVNFFFFCQQK